MKNICDPGLGTRRFRAPIFLANLMDASRRQFSTWILLILSACGSAWAGTANYYYDELGRLIETVAADGTSVQYAYDAVGNITSVRHNGATTIGISGFIPISGPVGTAVTVYGSGFSTTVASNVVKFNGKAATVTAATASSLTATVPTGATTGQIAITNGASTATSSGTFTVAGSGAPTLASFTPKIGSQGTVVTLTGTNFQTTKETDRVAFGTSTASVSAAAPTTITT